MTDKSTTTTATKASAEAPKVAPSAPVAAPVAAPSAPKPAPVTPDQTSTGPAIESELVQAQAETPDTATYYLRPGKIHNVIIRGENREISTAGTEVEFTIDQYNAFKDKFYTEAQYALAKDEGDISGAEGGTAADTLLLNAFTESATFEDRNAQAAAATGNSGGGDQVPE